MTLAEIRPKRHHNYVAFFLTLSCSLRCPYCINLHDGGRRLIRAKRKELTAEEWIRATGRLALREDLPLTLQGGEPTLHPGFYRLVNEVREDIRMDLMTNMMFDAAEFIRRVPLWRFSREAPYAAIRVSYHPGQNHAEDLIRKTLLLQEAGFRVGLYGIEHPDEALRAHILEVRDRCLALGLDFRTKEFLGEHGGMLRGTFKYEGCVSHMPFQSCDCRTTELIVDPAGNVHRCHADLYRGRRPIAHILDEDFSEETIDRFRECDYYGDCNPCDVKVKTDRFQVFGHTSVEIRNIRKGAHGQLPAGRS
jgi:hypothetical protein